MGGLPRLAKRPPARDPRSAHRRRAIATRRIGEGNKCACGEDRPEALIAGSDPMICAKCDRERKGQKQMDDHHIAGEANNSAATIRIPVNDHRADLNTAQQDWPKKTLQNSDHSPLLSAAAHIRGFADLIVYLLKTFLLWVAEMLELLDTMLERKLGKKWWKNTNLESFEPKP
jgi:hypothetical protein